MNTHRGTAKHFGKWRWMVLLFAAVTLVTYLTGHLSLGEAGRVVLLLAASTLVSEDLTCSGAGVLVAQGRISLALAVAGCLCGIFAGDLLLFLAGRYLGRSIINHAPCKWFLRPEGITRSSLWFERRGAICILLSRFVPGTRLPTYFVAGLLETSFWKFALYFLLAASVWTPALVWLSMNLGAGAAHLSLLAGQRLIFQLLISAALIYLAIKLVFSLASFRGRRLLVSRWKRLIGWEFWPAWFFYPPVILYICWLGIRHRRLTLFTCANPAIPGGGFVGESKAEILRQLSKSPMAGNFIARFALLPASLSMLERLSAAENFLASYCLTYPVALKPDVGERGRGVRIAKNRADLTSYLQQTNEDTIIQEYVAGDEFGVFYYRYPDEERGRLFSVTEKRFPFITGDGRSTLEELILTDRRAVCSARTFLRAHGARLTDVPDKGETIPLVELGSHCRGALFLDGRWAATLALEKTIDLLSREFPGFNFGRFDVRTASVEDFLAGENFSVIELNGVTSEATSIYDPRHSLLSAYRTLFRQWRIAFEIGRQNYGRGAAVPLKLTELFRLCAAKITGAPIPRMRDQEAGIFSSATGFIDCEGDCSR